MKTKSTTEAISFLVHGLEVEEDQTGVDNNEMTIARDKVRGEIVAGTPGRAKLFNNLGTTFTVSITNTDSEGGGTIGTTVKQPKITSVEVVIMI